MTRDEVMALTDEELRIKADVLMGNEECDVPCDGEIEEDAYGYWQCMKCGAHGDWDNMEHMRRRPNYPHDIAAAWELEDSLIAKFDPSEVGTFTTGPLEGWPEGFEHREDYRFRHPVARYIEALCQVLGVDPVGFGYEDFGTVEYGEISLVVHASPRDRTRAFIVAMENAA